MATHEDMAINPRYDSALFDQGSAPGYSSSTSQHSFGPATNTSRREEHDNNSPAGLKSFFPEMGVSTFQFRPHY